MGLFKLAALSATASVIAVSSIMPETVDAHAFLMLPKADITIKEKNLYAYVVPGEKVPPFSSYTTGNAERNSQGFVNNYKKLNPPNLRDFIMKNQVRTTDAKIPKTGTAECGFSNPNAAPMPLPDKIEFGNYQLSNREGIHPGPCEAWCDNEIVVPFTMDCRTILNKPITYNKAKCQGKSRLTFYWLATHFAPFQVYIGCAPLQGAKAGGNNNNGGNKNNGNVAGEANFNNTAPGVVKPAPVPAPAKGNNNGAVQRPTTPSPAYDDDC
ncbi:hypothetical protein Poli38472_000434 [Pythium oligandrum]|uniref:Uncharacterized protein n=1 Tax=Pythium oligandrum TaxID=41045 RepID=A0A8K1FI38_PYTOL|nr:hypothetical protein Poli38472_000434 [Pythium oligandrum]|eukprot:TMW60392.1 hypothetical protein Poli38472_000434 [Pythium oligandrum]